MKKMKSAIKKQDNTFIATETETRFDVINRRKMLENKFCDFF